MFHGNSVQSGLGLQFHVRCAEECNNVTRPAWQNRLAQSTAVDDDSDAPLRASINSPPVSHTPCSYFWVQLTREQSKIASYLFETPVVKSPS